MTVSYIDTDQFLLTGPCRWQQTGPFISEWNDKWPHELYFTRLLGPCHTHRRRSEPSNVSNRVQSPWIQPFEVDHPESSPSFFSLFRWGSIQNLCSGGQQRPVNRDVSLKVSIPTASPRTSARGRRLNWTFFLRIMAARPRGRTHRFPFSFCFWPFIFTFTALNRSHA